MRQVVYKMLSNCGGRGKKEKKTTWEGHYMTYKEVQLNARLCTEMIKFNKQDG